MVGESLEDFGHMLDVDDVSWTWFELVVGVTNVC